MIKLGHLKSNGFPSLKRKVIKYDLKTHEIIKEYESCIEAARDHEGNCSNNISMVCRGKRKQYKGFGYRYK